MKFHLPSYLLGLATAAIAGGAQRRLRPVVVEGAALAKIVMRSARAIVERQKEWLEDLWADIDDRVEHRETNNGVAREAARPAAET
jgi:hypothetical protein